jgi:hypothetical protein
MSLLRHPPLLRPDANAVCLADVPRQLGPKKVGLRDVLPSEQYCTFFGPPRAYSGSFQGVLNEPSFMRALQSKRKSDGRFVLR